MYIDMNVDIINYSSGGSGFSAEEKQSIEVVTNNIISSISALIKKDLDLFSIQVNQKQ